MEPQNLTWRRVVSPTPTPLVVLRETCLPPSSRCPLLLQGAWLRRLQPSAVLVWRLVAASKDRLPLSLVGSGDSRAARLHCCVTSTVLLRRLGGGGLSPAQMPGFALAPQMPWWHDGRPFGLPFDACPFPGFILSFERIKTFHPTQLGLFATVWSSGGERQWRCGSRILPCGRIHFLRARCLLSLLPPDLRHNLRWMPSQSGGGGGRM